MGSRTIWTVSLAALSGLAAWLAPRLLPSEPAPSSAEEPPAWQQPMAPAAVIPEVIPEVTQPRPIRPKPEVIPEVVPERFDPWEDGCPACGMG